MTIKAQVVEYESSLPGLRARKNAEYIRDWHRTGKEVDTAKLEQAGKLILEALGEDPNRDGLKNTPKRFAKYYSQIMNGNFLDPKDFVTEFENDGGYSGPVVLQNARMYSMCEHHLALFTMDLNIAYQPRDTIVGLSKLVRIARVYAKRPQVQERLTQQISDAIYKTLAPEWSVVKVSNAEHFCMSIRGVRLPGTSTTTMHGHGNWPKDIFNI